jgi:signal transduction histidine kinase
MSIFTNRDIKRLFILLLGVFALFIILSQGYFLLSDGAPNIVLLLLSLFLAVCVVIGFSVYFHRQQKMIDTAIAQINLFMSGNRDARIDSDNEGSLFKLFHAVNTLATTLNAHAVREQNTKAFLRNTISDISHQLKTPLAALEIYNSLLQEESGDKAAVCGFALKSEKEIERIETLVQNLLKITRLDAGFIVMEKRIENISGMMNDMKAHFETRAAQEQKEITLSGSPDITLLCDRDWMMEAVSNIIKNALDHTGAGGRIEGLWNN